VFKPGSDRFILGDWRGIPRLFSITASNARNSESTLDNSQHSTDRCSFGGAYCQSCNDIDLNRAELRYRFVAILEQEDHDLPVIVADEDAVAFLPPLPPLSTAGNPNDHRRTQQRIREASAQALDVLLGAKQDGERPRPIVDFSLETYEVKRKEKGEIRGVVVSRVFGMQSRT